MGWCRKYMPFFNWYTNICYFSHMQSFLKLEDNINKIKPFTDRETEIQEACLWSHCWNHIIGRGRIRTGILFLIWFFFFFNLFSNSVCFPVILIPVAFKRLEHEITEKANLESKQAFLPPLPHLPSSPHPSRKIQL